MPGGCVFCKIANRELSAEIVYEDEEIMAFKDISPAAPVHLLVIPRKHIPTLLDLNESDTELVGRLHLVAADLARAFNVDNQGFRVIFNCGPDAGQAVYHLHLHLLGGRPMTDLIAKES